MANVVIPAVNSIPQGEPREGRLSLELGENGKAGLNFALGTEVFAWNSGALQTGQRLTAILSAWVDNTAMPVAGSGDPPNYLVVQIGRQTFQIPAGVQTYILCAPYMPTTVTISESSGVGEASFGVQVILYNYNVSFTGAAIAGTQPLPVGAPAPPPADGTFSATLVGGGGVVVGGGGGRGGRGGEFH